MSAKAIAGIVSFCVGLSGTILGNLFLFAMIGEINRKRRDGDVVSYFGFTFPKILRIFGEYRNSYPRGTLHIYLLACIALMVLGFVGFVAILASFQ